MIDYYEHDRSLGDKMYIEPTYGQLKFHYLYILLLNR